MSHRPPRRLWSGVLVLTLLLAGCSGLPATDGGAQTPTVSVENFSYPSGWSQDGIEDVSDAVATHRDAVTGVSRTTRAVTLDGEYNRTIVRRVDADAGTASLRFVDTTFDNDVSVYYSDAGVFEYDLTTGELVTRANDAWEMNDVGTVEQETLSRPLDGVTLSASDTVLVEGTTAVEYTVTGLADPDRIPANEASGTVVVTREGYVASLNVTKSNEDYWREMTYSVTDVGSTDVERPDWAPEE